MNQIALDLQPSEPEYRTITLTQGQFAIVDAADFDWLTRWKWHAYWNHKTQSFYAKRSVYRSGKKPLTIYMHRFIIGIDSGVQVDHRDHATLNNRRTNLRPATRSQQKQNKRIQRNNKSGFKGVRARNRKWNARIWTSGRSVSLGYYATPEEASAAYITAAKALHEDFFCAISAP